MNEPVPAILGGTEPPAIYDSLYVTMGGPHEATCKVLEFGKARKDTPGAIAWLLGTADPAIPKRKRIGRRRRRHLNMGRS